ncbi:hypothetical protein [Achromobacter deleyi]|uniref:hypothetical protein n=1 Tax=Achromobacter deleyi TaxID=1353891 RepID=UPI0014915D7E|nr:hypothetical protein [Achromobacter deleyi]QVQ27755.1 hypothetical protein HLG70_04720 [Achromobacter deleyi]UIP23357.1 hypothetical protein LYZ39_12835 [Achromobacter deleyi]
MNDKTKTWRSSTTTRSWSSTTDLTPEQRVNIEDLLDGAMDGVTVSEKWSYAGTENGKTFEVEINDGAVTVNGRRYASLDEVPQAERERIEALRNGEGMEGLWAMLKSRGIDTGNLTGAQAAQDAKPAFTIETDDSDTAPARPASSGPAGGIHASTDSALPPGAVPAGGGLRRTLLIGIAIGLALWVARALNLF